MKRFLLNLFFPKFCLCCRKEGDYLCTDCQALFNISDRFLKLDKNLSTLYFATDYENFIIRKLIQNLKYHPFAKDLTQTLVSIIIIYFQNLENKPEFLKNRDGFVIMPLPLHQSRLRWRGFNQAEEIARLLAEDLKIPLSSDVLIRKTKTPPQLNLPQADREENIKGVFFCSRPESVRNKKVLLIDDVSTTGSTLEEAAKVLKEAGARSVEGIVFAKG